MKYRFYPKDKMKLTPNNVKDRLRNPLGDNSVLSNLLSCTKCQQNMIHELVEKKVDRDHFDMGLQCTNCGQWTHSYFESLSMRQAQTTLKLLRAGVNSDKTNRTERKKIKKELNKKTQLYRKFFLKVQKACREFLEKQE